MNIQGHFETITRHKMLVMRYCFECGLYAQGLAHEMCIRDRHPDAAV